MMYRVAKNVGDGVVGSAQTSRPPGNVPYYVDNIWEWLRPAAFPSRRKSAFASPTPQLAAAAAQGDVKDSWQVKLTEGQRAYQIQNGPTPEDARYHADITNLKSLIMRSSIARCWFDLPVSKKMPEAILFVPCLSKSEVQEIISESTILDESNIKSVSTFWNDIVEFDPDGPPPHPTGEIFFEGAYRLYKNSHSI